MTAAHCNPRRRRDDHYADAVRLQQRRASRELIAEGIDRDGTFLDIGCANGLLMESVRRWAAE